MTQIPHSGETYGWLYPDGRFRESGWGTHSEAARKIIYESGCGSEYSCNGCMNEGDFLCLHGFCLVHNPGRGKNIAVTHIRPLTRKQREFLCDYFLRRGEARKAEEYLDEVY